jgi:H+/Cl- antiporter ClcA
MIGNAEQIQHEQAPDGPAQGAWRRRLATIVGGVLLGLAALGFARLADGAQSLFDRFEAPHVWLTAAAAPCLFMAVAWVTTRWFAGARGSGIPQVIALVSSPGRAATSPYLALPVVAAKAALTPLMLLAGAAVGREGPTVQIATALNVAVHRWLRVPITSGRRGRRLQYAARRRCLRDRGTGGRL